MNKILNDETKYITTKNNYDGSGNREMEVNGEWQLIDGIQVLVEVVE